ncbi:peptidase dimerization domain protein [Candidatus Falkowbacteria bacterium RIFOXYB2_FULL_47_14]|uniref:Peptidase dimerization domain protein n=1 Tax=Candidatus Falkowbacteria bacterium RIFOXYA2_FULL_47_19 TaxID=1797994 RepID=A0A1F5SHS9_9BACT|nr:MAG: peptidase dimerization domain protein [Candidatus Falkowbacteria bacterium RIFOXYA2_FULL_47_19]OGF36586.1 MAG: peptidase dimerization domain protein [Candidatus Falkowbacteria bacterium RIFOXYC2_FULL_46_15]OGF42504.1 MAG: peptidase dimerization domain protein [Candidatus Falkowbacteria bacterium RIFOXYB2_FULL_47_14]
MTDVKRYLKTNQKKFLSELFELLRFPSISTDPERKKDVLEAARFIKEKLSAAGAAQAAVESTGGHPVVYGEKIIDKKLPTVLVYGHYDVQPVDPVELWNSRPFEPTVKNGKIFARGASDDKGQMYAHIKAFEYLARSGRLPVNVKFIIEGEEEIGSVNLDAYIRKNRKKLAADIVLISDTEMFSNSVPSITAGLKGLVYLEVELTGPDHDLHSGVYGGAVANPINVLCEIIARLKDKNGRITIPGFYDDVVPLTPSERRSMKKIPFNLARYKKELGIAEVFGEKGYSTLERAGARPTLDVNGIWGGFTGEGSKTVLPSKAHAKISMRLVPGQNPKKITTLFIDHFKALAPKTVKVKIKTYTGGEPFVTALDSPVFRAASAAYARSFGKKPLPLRTGGSIPITALFKKILGAEPILMGFGLDSDAIHSPNESFGVWNYLKAIETIIYFYESYRK